MDNRRNVFSLVSAGRASEKKEDAKKKFEKSSIDSYRNMDIDYLYEDLAEFDEIPREVNEKEIIQTFGLKFIQSIPKGYVLSKKLGQGAFGSTFSICKDRLTCLAIKVVHLKHGKQDLINEINMQQAFHQKGLAPKIMGEAKFYKHHDKQYGIIIMEQIDNVLDNILSKNLFPKYLDEIIHGFLHLVERMMHFGICHADAHAGNIAVNFKKDATGKLTLQLSLIDFGNSQIDNGAWPDLEILQFLRCLDIVDPGEPGVTPYNKKYIWDRLIAFYQSNFDSQIKTEQQVDDEFNEVFDRSS